MGVGRFPQGGNFEGEYFKGKKQGKGKLTFTDGAIYEGEFKYDMIKGAGILTSEGEKTTYIGHWNNNIYHVNGNLTIGGPYPHEFVGVFKNGAKNGKGTMTWSDGSSLTVTWLDGKKNGLATYIETDGLVKLIEFNNDTRM